MKFQGVESLSFGAGITNLGVESPTYIPIESPVCLRIISKKTYKQIRHKDILKSPGLTGLLSKTKNIWNLYKYETMSM